MISSNNLVAQAVTINGKQKIIIGRREDDNIVLYDISEPTDADVFVKLPMPCKKLWSVDCYFIKNIIDAYRKWDSNTIG